MVAAQQLDATRGVTDAAALEAALGVGGLGDADAVGHRIVHGGERFREPVLVDDDVRRALDELTDLAPLHQPAALAVLDRVRDALPGVPAVACFDTAFHSTLAPAATTYALPAAWRERFGLRRFGFHGLSHAHVGRRVGELLGDDGSAPRIVSCHLGAGASLCAIADGRSVDTTMGFTPLEGLVMATRSGSVDPGLIAWLIEHGGLAPGDVFDALEHESGLTGLAGTGDLRGASRARGRRRPGRDARDRRLHPPPAADRSPRWPPRSAGSTRSRSPAASASTTRRSALAPPPGSAFLGVAVDDARNATADGDDVISPDGADGDDIRHHGSRGSRDRPWGARRRRLTTSMLHNRDWCGTHRVWWPTMRRSSHIVLLATLGALLAAAPASATSITIGGDGETASAFDLTQAIRERVFIPQPGIDQDGDGVDDKIAIEISGRWSRAPRSRCRRSSTRARTSRRSAAATRASASATSTATASTTAGRCSYDNYFVPRGYAVILAEMNGTGNSTGCPLHGGPGDVAGMKSVIDWLNGRVPGVDAAGNPVLATWHNGKAGDDRQVLRRHADQRRRRDGRRGADDDRPESAISDWYDYSRIGGVRPQRRHPLPGDRSSSTVTDADRGSRCCAPIARRRSSSLDGDATGDMNAFWDARNYLPDVGNVKASVFATHGLQDDNVTHRPVRPVVGRARRAQRAAQAVVAARGPRRPVRLAPRGVGRHAAPLVRPLAAAACRTGSWASRASTSRTAGRLGHVRRLAAPGTVDDRRLPPGHDGGQRRRAAA